VQGTQLLKLRSGVTHYGGDADHPACVVIPENLIERQPGQVAVQSRHSRRDLCGIDRLLKR